ncbi:succinic semialdehyde dehydrogenase [Actinopolymorpha alba]|uniref:succinic semialdehyde dehydrogenase n=1 Tax=Actinopolymorpha alba TaxID=533267 RepID=UPI000370F9D5|nr:succinic semialdehyde dehydrogenase [Actinopolymorpha alba]
MTAPTQEFPRLSAERVAALTGRVFSTSGETIASVTPVTGEKLADVPLSSVDDVAAAFARARKAQAEWARVPITERAELLLRLHDLVFERQRDILDIVQWESGKARKHAFEELCDVAMNARYYARVAQQHLLPTRRAGLFPLLTHTVELRHPKGVIGVIAPWNYPLTMAISDALPALVAGNAVITKPATQTVLSGLLGAELLADAGLPEDVWQVVVGEGRRVGAALIDQADFVCFTGSTETGRSVARRCGERLIGCTLELGGKNPLLVLDDADVDKAAECAVRGCFSNAGQLCISIERLYVAAPVYDAFLERFVARVEAMRVEPAFTFDADMGSLISEQQLATVTAHVEDAVSKGAQVLAGGKARPDLGPYFFEPTVLTDVTPEMTCFASETFGPVVSVYRVADDDEAVAAANDSPYGLNASVHGRDLRRARAVASRLRAGTVNINEAYAAAWGSIDSPMGGVGDSGLGRRHGVDGLLKYTEPQTIAVQRVPVAPPGRVPYDVFARAITTGLRALRKAGRR